MPIYLCFGRRPSQSESRRSATCHNKRRNAHHHKRAMASPRYSTRARVRDCAPTNNTHPPTTQRRRRRRRRRARHRRFPSPRERRRERTRERKERTRGFLDGGIAPKGAQTHSRRPTSAHKQGRRPKNPDSETRAAAAKSSRATELPRADRAAVPSRAAEPSSRAEKPRAQQKHLTDGLRPKTQFAAGRSRGRRS
mgnify:CR=1 FL=1